jgi:hypothetical protein
MDNGTASCSEAPPVGKYTVMRPNQSNVEWRPLLLLLLLPLLVISNEDRCKVICHDFAIKLLHEYLIVRKFAVLINCVTRVQRLSRNVTCVVSLLLRDFNG